MGTKINPQLIAWLKHNMASDTMFIGIYEDSGRALESEMILTCYHAGLLDFDEYTGDVIYYRLTPQGEILTEHPLSIPATEASTPDSGAGERFQVTHQRVHGKIGKYVVVDTMKAEIVSDSHTDFERTAREYAKQLNIRERNGLQATSEPAPVAAVGERMSSLDWFLRITKLADLVEEEQQASAALRGQLAAAQVEVARLQTDNTQLWEHINYAIKALLVAEFEANTTELRSAIRKALELLQELEN